jgi:AmmeMemoRadiSam system protein A
MLSPDQQSPLGVELLRLARASIEHGFEHAEPLPIDSDGLPPEMSEMRATFTTLREGGRLRGCCGTLQAVRPLAKDVAHSAFQAAFRDPRFEPLCRHELNDVDLEVAVLSPMEPLPVDDEADLLEKLRSGTDGLVIIEGSHRATFLPKVWEQLPNPPEFLGALKMKCGLPKDYWSERLAFQRYTTVLHTEPK